MNYKKLTLIIASIFLFGIIASFGIVSANNVNSIGEIENPSGINISDFTAGTVTQAEFSFEYKDNIDADEHFPLIYKISFNSSEEIPEVWKNDFNITGGTVKRNILGGSFNEITLECTNEFPVTIDHQIGSETIEEGENGTFYCYNTTEGTISQLDKHNKVYLDITTHPALVPGEYNIIAEMFYLNDSYSPKLKLVNESYFDQYFTDGDDISFKVKIEEPYLESYESKVIRENEDDIDFIGSSVVNKTDVYKFVHQSISISEGNYTVDVLAEDINNNVNKINTTLKIDNTAPEIELIQPTGEDVYSEILPVELNVTDEKAGVDNESVEIRLREIVNGTICPTTGDSIGNYFCTTTEWIKLDLNETTGNFEKEVNTTKYNLDSGEYWLDAKAKDILGNEAWWVQEEE